MQPSLLPLALTRLRSAKDDAERDDAWTQFVAAHSDVLLHACRHVLHDGDVAMDAAVRAGFLVASTSSCPNDPT